MNIRSNVGLLYGARFFSSLIPAYVIERLFWESRGMSVQMVVYTEILFAVTIVLLEIPTGILADRWGRKKLLLLAAVLGCAEFLILLYATTFWHFALVVFLAAIARSAGSGADHALLYDTLLVQGKERDFEKILGRLNSLDIAATMIAALSGSLLAGRFGFELNYGLSLLGTAIALVLTLGLVEPRLTTGQEEESPLPIRVVVKGSLAFFYKHRAVALVVCAGMVTGAAISFVDEFWQLVLDETGVSVAYFGLASAGMFLLRMPGNLLAHALLKRYRVRRLLTVLLLMATAGFMLLSMFPGTMSLLAIGWVCLFVGVMEPVTAGYLHHRIDSKMRATLDSFQSLGLHLMVIILGLGFGFLADHMSLWAGFGYIALVCGVYVLIFVSFFRRDSM